MNFGNRRGPKGPFPKSNWPINKNPWRARDIHKGFKLNRYGQPLPGCNFVVKVSPPHHSFSHKLHNDPPVARNFTTHRLSPGGNRYMKNPSSSWHKPFRGQTRLRHFKIGKY